MKGPGKGRSPFAGAENQAGWRPPRRPLPGSARCCNLSGHHKEQSQTCWGRASALGRGSTPRFPPAAGKMGTGTSTSKIGQVQLGLCHFCLLVTTRLLEQIYLPSTRVWKSTPPHTHFLGRGEKTQKSLESLNTELVSERSNLLLHRDKRTLELLLFIKPGIIFKSPFF